MRIAVIGAGIAGLGAAWWLSKRHDVTVFEKSDYLGGHSNTVDAPNGDRSIPVDTGFIVFNERTYPNLVRLFQHLDVPVKKTEMSFAVSLDNGQLEYGCKNVWQMFAQHRNWFSPRFHGMVADLLRFYRTAETLLESPTARDLSLGDYLKLGRYKNAFVDDHLLPMAAAIWSCPADTMRAFPAQSFLRFFVNHGLLEVYTKNRPQWYTVDDGSREYVRRMRADIDGVVSPSRAAAQIRRQGGKAIVRDIHGAEQSFDEVVLACHADEALALLADPTTEERRILGAFRYSKNLAVLHQDKSHMPKRRRIWSAWNYLHDRNGADGTVAVTYWMNRLQSLDPSCPLFVTLNPDRPFAPNTELRRFKYDHPIFDGAATLAQTRLPAIQGVQNLWFCGSYCGYGFHEDGLASAIAVAGALGVNAPWGHHDAHAMAAVAQRPAGLALAAE